MLCMLLPAIRDLDEHTLKVKVALRDDVPLTSDACASVLSIGCHS